MYFNCIKQNIDNQYFKKLSEKEKIIFNQLKEAVAQTFLKENDALSPDISLWKGEDIIKFQEDLSDKVKGRVSEKWFYNYFRNDIQKLPRIDMLNLLSEYVGAENWATFKARHTKAVQRENSKTNYRKIALVAVAIAVVAFLAFQLNTKAAYTVKLCFIDESTQTIHETVTVVIDLDGETPKTLQSKNGNCVVFKTDKAIMNINIKSPYYKEKQLTRKLTNSDYAEDIVLETDVYSLILRRYSNSSTSDWKARREKLNTLIAEDAIIYQQWFGTDKGVEMYSKADFVYQMTVPTSMLKHIEILETRYKAGKIAKLRFRVNQ